MPVSRKILFILAALSLTGCAHPMPPPPVVDVTAMDCSPSVNLESATPIKLDSSGEKTETAILDSHAGCVLEPGGYRSLYRVFLLPAMVPSVVTVAARPWGNTILAPRASFLDSDGKALRETTHADFAFRGLELSALLRNHPDEKYLVVTSDAEVLGQAISRISGAVQSTTMAAGPVFFTAYSGTDTAINLVYGPAGTVVVSIAPLPKK